MSSSPSSGDNDRMSSLSASEAAEVSECSGERLSAPDRDDDGREERGGAAAMVRRGPGEERVG